jgi:Tfp pilus assembly protein PilF
VRQSLFIAIATALASGLCATGCDRRAPAATPVAISATAAVAATPAPTFYADVAPILYQHCAGCHRPVNPAAAAALAASDEDPLCVAGAPFSVLDYAAVRRRRMAIAAAVQSRTMPPWLPEPGQGDFAHERRLDDAQIATIARWAEEGAPEGDPSRRPAPPPAADGWQLGTPDLVLTLPESYVLAPGSRDIFRSFVVPVALTETRYVRGVEFRADNPRVLHHANIAIDPGRLARALDRADAGPGFAVMPDEDAVQNVHGWSPGKVPFLDEPDTAWAIEPGTDLVVQLHMVGGATNEPVRPSIGLFFSDRPPTRTPITIKLESKDLHIRPGQTDYVVEDSYVLPADVALVSVYPHAHSLAREMRGQARRPDGTVVPLLSIRQWDVRWQDQYRYRTPVVLPRGTTLSMRFTYDNSAGNPNNPSRPPRAVGWGPLSTDEMAALWLEVIPQRPQDAGTLVADYVRRAQAQDLLAAERLVAREPGNGAAHNRLATKYLQAGRVDAALGSLGEALRINPRDADALSNLGTVLQAQGHLREALERLREAVRLRPDDDRLRFNLGNALYASGLLDEATRELEGAVRLNPENADAHFNLAMILGPQNRLTDATTHLRRVLDVNPRHAEAHRNLAVAYGLAGRLDAAIEHARIAVRLAPESSAARDHLARLLAARTPR